MEFNEKLQGLRKSRGLTQEELAEVLFVSRAAVSKWESGRGYPSIDSLKDISKFFSVSVDDLLSGDKLLSIAEKESKSGIRNLCDLLFGFIDLFSFIFAFLPLFPNTIDGYVYSVSLLDYTPISQLKLIAYWVMFALFLVIGITKLMLRKVKTEKANTALTGISLVLNIIAVLFFALAREVYAVVVIFMMLIIKGIILLKYIKGK